MKPKMCFIDVETGGVDPEKSALLQLSGIIEIEEQIVEEFNFYLSPFKNDEVNDEALKVNNFTKEMLFNHPFENPMEVHNKFTNILSKYVDRYNKEDKLFFCGYNNQSFDSPFVRKFFDKCNDKFFGSFFWHPGIDMMMIYSRLLIHERHKLENFKLPTVAKFLGLSIEHENLHDAMYDVRLTRELWLMHNR